jgi:aminoglycoside phosphotransferase (APT) family kinase protein
VKVPRPLFVESGDEALGAPFVVVEQSSGRVVEPDYWRASAPPSIARDLARQMALLHAQPIGELDAMLPHAREGAGRQAWIEELDRLEQMWRRQSHGESITMEASLQWLRANVDCVEDRRAIVHNDLVFHNVLADQGEISAVLDWEQASIGHPGEDLGYCYPVVSRVMDWADFMAVYRDAGGPALSDREIDYFSLRAILRLSVLVHHGRDAFEGGHTNDIVVVGAGAFFIQRLMRRMGDVLTDVLARDAARRA